MATPHAPKGNEPALHLSWNENDEFTPRKVSRRQTSRPTTP